MTTAERLALRIMKNRQAEQVIAMRAPAFWTLETIIRDLNEDRHRASYGAVAKLLGRSARSWMSGRAKCWEDSWVVAGSGPGSGWPTDYGEENIHPACLVQCKTGPGGIIDDAEDLREWLQRRVAVSEGN